MVGYNGFFASQVNKAIVAVPGFKVGNSFRFHFAVDNNLHGLPDAFIRCF